MGMGQISGRLDSDRRRATGDALSCNSNCERSTFKRISRHLRRSTAMGCTDLPGGAEVCGTAFRAQ